MKRPAAAFATLALAFAVRVAAADDAPPQPSPDESVLGTVEVNGSAESMVPLPKLAVVPTVTTGAADATVQLVVRRDMDLSGQFEVLGEDAAPQGPFTRTTPIDLAAWRAQGAEYVLRVFAQPAEGDSAKTELVAEAWAVPPAAAKPPEDAKPNKRIVVPTATTEIRAASHRLVDRVLGALTGRPGGFASEMTYAQKVGRWRRVFALDADGFDLRAVGPSDATALSPSFGPGAQIFYALSRDYSPFRIAFGPDAAPVPVEWPGSVLGLAFNADRSRMALTVMQGGKSALWVGDRGVLHPVPTAPFANHPAFAPTGKIAYVAGSPVQRIFVADADGANARAISPPGFMASAPVFCDTPQGLLVVFTVGVGSGADIIATDTSGGSLRRLTQHQGASTYSACSPDGRLVAFFSTGKQGIARTPAPGDAAARADAGAGLFVMPIQRPWLAKKISGEVGESLRWEGW